MTVYERQYDPDQNATSEAGGSGFSMFIMPNCPILRKSYGGN